MKRNSFKWALVACLIACASAHSYEAQPSYGSGGQQSYGSDAAADAAAASTGGAGEYGHAGDAAAAPADAGQSNYGSAPSNYGSAPSYNSEQTVPYKPVNKGNTLTSSITYPQNKGEILIHRPAPIIVRRPPTKVLVNHPPLVVKPAPVVLHKPPAIVLRKVYIKHHPRRVKVEPVFVNVVKPPAEKYFVNENKQGYGHSQSNKYAAPGPIVAGAQQLGSSGAQGLPAYASGADSAAANAGYQLLQGGNHGLSTLASIAGERDTGYAGPSQHTYGPAQPAADSYPAPAY